jgi:hypothetical protein
MESIEARLYHLIGSPFSMFNAARTVEEAEPILAEVRSLFSRMEKEEDGK